MSALLLALLLAAGDVEEEHADLSQRLDAERAAFDALGSERKNLLGVLDTMERLARESAQRAGELERANARLQLQAREVHKEQGAVQAAMREQEKHLAPRLLALYRLQKKDALGFLLQADDFATLVKRQRAMGRLVESDARALDELARVSRYEKAQARRLERLELTSQKYLKALRTEQAVGRARLERFGELLATVNAESNRKSRVIAELEAAEKQLAQMVADLSSSGATTGFRARRGHLPYPTHGVVEVGFGKVVNPRFNTVTVQKGIDLRAAAGTPVVSIGQGTVAFSGWLKGYGNLVILDHGSGYHSLYAHLSGSKVEVGNVLEEGEELGQVGDTGSLKGAYLYFEIRKAGQAVDPLPWLSSEGAP